MAIQNNLLLIALLGSIDLPPALALSNFKNFKIKICTGVSRKFDFFWFLPRENSEVETKEEKQALGHILGTSWCVIGTIQMPRFFDLFQQLREAFVGLYEAHRL